ncbi:MAG: bifunctional adenosylcobinamide kinase/adenosylcobinamide-phosphate guanylyltransferase [Lentisphaeria bacterium]|nr:bifunctional adenosylcobinamide kinase/adenosylcobinamide-phosphate guanylyltransferase [Lentisphaeria bacterium]
MSNKIVLVTGGARSGKSRLAEELVLRAEGTPFYIATAPVLDSEMAERVRLHRERRAAANWTTIEEERNLVNAIRLATAEEAGAVLVDCLTLWINNLLYENPELSETQMAEKTHALAGALRDGPPLSVLVINEVGLGIVPESPLARRFRDLSGRCAQIIAAAADEVYFTVAGIAQRIK